MKTPDNKHNKTINYLYAGKNPQQNAVTNKHFYNIHKITKIRKKHTSNRETRSKTIQKSPATQTHKTQQNIQTPQQNKKIHNNETPHKQYISQMTNDTLHILIQKHPFPPLLYTKLYIIYIIRLCGVAPCGFKNEQKQQIKIKAITI